MDALGGGEGRRVRGFLVSLLVAPCFLAQWIKKCTRTIGRENCGKIELTGPTFATLIPSCIAYPYKPQNMYGVEIPRGEKDLATRHAHSDRLVCRLIGHTVCV